MVGTLARAEMSQTTAGEVSLLLVLSWYLSQSIHVRRSVICIGCTLVIIILATPTHF